MRAYASYPPKRKMFLALYWEDRDRDDADGPDSSVQ